MTARPPPQPPPRQQVPWWVALPAGMLIGGIGLWQASDWRDTDRNADIDRRVTQLEAWQDAAQSARMLPGAEAEFAKVGATMVALSDQIRELRRQMDELRRRMDTLIALDRRIRGAHNGVDSSSATRHTP